LRSNVLAIARTSLIALLIGAIIALPAYAASASPLGSVMLAQHARLDNADAAVGASVYTGDALSTGEDGSLRLRIATSQLYLFSSTEASLALRESTVQAKVNRGSLGFSMSAPGQLEISTPLGVIRAANGQHVFGRVVVLSPTRIQVGAQEGSLVVAAIGGAEKLIGPGETYEATLEAASTSAASVPQDAQSVGKDGIRWKRVLGFAIVIGGAAIVTAWTWHELTESCTKPSNCD
jgi:hypothetical protein